MARQRVSTILVALAATAMNMCAIPRAPVTFTALARKPMIQNEKTRLD